MLTYLPADTSDIDVLYVLSKSLIERYEDLTSIDLPDVLAWVRRKLEKKISEYRTAYLDGQKVGYFRLCDSGEGMLEIDDLYVLDAYQGRGIGSEIIRFCISESKRVNKPLMLYVFTDNVHAAALYEKHGFSVSEIVSPTRRILIRRP